MKIEAPSPTPAPQLPGDLLIAVAVILVSLFTHLGAFGLVGPDEPRYAWIARAMAQTNDWITPKLYGDPWFEKPILYYWAAALGFRLHLPAEWAARLPSAFAALAAAMGLFWLGRKFYGSDREPSKNSIASPALLAPVIFSASVAGIGFARAATPDMLFSASIALAMVAAAAYLRTSDALHAAANDIKSNNSSSLGILALFGAFLGLGVLAKGPAAVILAGGAIAIWALAASQLRIALRFFHPVAIASFCVVALPWYVLCALRNPDFLHVFIFQHNFQRYLTPLFQHKQPFWFFGPITLLALLPWTAFLIFPALDARRILQNRAWRNSPGFFFACWAVFPVLFFSLSQSKLPSYILPAVAPLAMVLAVSAKNIFGPNRAASIAASLAVAISWLALGFAAIRYFLPDPRAALAEALLLGVAVIAALAALVAGARFKLKWLVISTAVAVALAVEISGLALLPVLDPDLSARERAGWITANGTTDFYTFHLTRSWGYGLAFYADRPIAEWSPENLGPASILTTEQGLLELKKLGRFSGPVSPQERGMRYVKIEAAAR
jgi:4-amino-4-deoxy-L-arabinose transferase-like glycosyltransferase